MRRTSKRSFVALFLAIVTGGVARAQCPVNVPHVNGTWRTLPYGMPINPISATLLHTGQILVVAGSENDADNNLVGAQSYRYVVWDPTGVDSNSITVKNVDYDVFCSGTAQLRDGRTLIEGGSSDYTFKGDKRASIFDPLTQKWVQSQNMADGRWYGTATALGDGRIMAFSGVNSTGGTNNTVQIYDLANAGAGWDTAISQPFTPPLFPRTFLLPSGKVFFTAQGAGSPSSNAWIFDPVAKTWTSSVANTGNRAYGSAVLLPLLPPSYTPKVMNFGGGSPGKKTTESIDLSAMTPAWTAGPDMSTYRVENNAVILPTGEILVSGGSQTDEGPDTAGKTADLYTPSLNSFRSGGTAAFSRLYHSTALLLPDATVMSTGGNPGGRGSFTGGTEIYTPPYLYDASDRRITTNRPAITAVNPEILSYGQAFTLNYTTATSISSAVLIRPGSTTHAFDMDQRLVGLCGPSPQPACSGAPGVLNLTAPSSGNVAPPGFYMLFLVDSAGVPSVAHWVQLSSFGGSAPPDGAITTPASDTTISAGGSVSFDTTTSASKYSWVFPGGTPATSSAKTPGSVTFSSPGVFVTSLTVIDGGNNSDESPPNRTITVLPATANFNLTVTPVRTITPGQPGTFTVTVQSLSGFGGTVTLTVSSESGFPSGVTNGGFSPSTIVGSGSSTLTMNTTTATIPYALSLTVKGTSGSTVHTAATTLLMISPAPTGLVATPTDGQVSLSWLASTGASSYRLSRSLYAGGPYQTLSCPTSPGYNDAGLTNGTTYYYVVQAVYTGGPANGGTSAYSTEVSGLPPCPTVGTYTGSLGATKSESGAAVWSWTAGGSQAYDLVRGDLGTLVALGGDFTAALNALPVGENACLADGTTSLTLTDPYGAGAPGSGVFTILRPVTIACPAHGTYDEGAASQAGSRDAEIAASGRSCP